MLNTQKFTHSTYITAKSDPLLRNTLRKFKVLVEDVKNYRAYSNLNHESEEYLDTAINLIQDYVKNNLSIHECYFLCSLYINVEKDEFLIYEYTNSVELIGAIVFERLIMLNDNIVV